MPDFSKRSYQKELLDRDDIPFEDISRNMHELNVINSLLGGHAITIAGLQFLLDQLTISPSQKIYICEIGCGGGDNLKAIAKYCGRKNINVQFIGVDINPDCIAHAQKHYPDLPVKWIVSDYKKIVFDHQPHIIFSSLFCHHFTNEELVYQLKWMRENATAGFFINDLHRHPLAYRSIKLLTTIFSKSYLVKNDAPLSVLRGFSKTEWLQLLSEAGIRTALVKWKWAFRWLVLMKTDRDPSSYITQSA